MHGRPARLWLSLGLLVLALVALATTAAVLTGPTVGPTRDIGVILAFMAFDPRCWLQLGLAMAGVTAAVLPIRTSALAGGLAGLSVLVGLGLAVAVWVPAELAAHRVALDGAAVDRASFPPEGPRIFFLGGIYLVALIHLIVGLAGSTLTLAAVQVRSRSSRAPD